MKREVLVDQAPARIELENGTLTYERSTGEESAGGGSLRREFSIVPLTPGCYSVLLAGRSYRVYARGLAGQVTVGGRSLNMEVFDPRDLRSGGRTAAGEGRQNVISPMPGKVVRVLVAVGDPVVQGQGLVVVEAMKMQNEMKSPKTGQVAEIRTQADRIVAAGDVLVVVE